MRASPMWAVLEALAPTLPYDAAIMDGTQRGDPSPLKQWASVTVPTLVMDGTTMMGREDFHRFMRHGANEIATVLPECAAAHIGGSGPRSGR